MSEQTELSDEYNSYTKDWSGGLDIHEDGKEDGRYITLIDEELQTLRDVLNDRFSDDDDGENDDSGKTPVQNFRDVERRLQALEGG